MLEFVRSRLPEGLKPALREGRILAVRALRAVRGRRLPTGRDGTVRLHIGCGEVDAPGFINVDARYFPHVHLLRRDVAHLPEFADGSVDMIYLSHVLEHFRRGRQREILACYFGKLKPGGVLRLGVPDFDVLLRMYEESGRDIRSIEQPLMGEQDYDLNCHFMIYNERYLTELLEGTGFREVRRWEPARDGFHDFEDWSSRPIEIGGRRYAPSLNLEGVKPTRP